MTAQAIERMRKTITRLGISTDWSNEYITMMPEYYGKTQASFVQMYQKDMIYRRTIPSTGARAARQQSPLPRWSTTPPDDAQLHEIPGL